MGRLGRMLDAKFTLNTIDERIQEVGDLERIFERCDSDIDELRTMRRALNFYKDAAARLGDENLSEDGVASLLKELTENADAELSDDEPPWMPDEVMPLLHKEALRKREEMGFRWLTSMENEVSEMNGIDIALASNLHSRLQQTPGYLTKPQQKTAKKLCNQTEAYLSTLKVEWLLGKYRELDSGSQSAFLEAIGMEERPNRRNLQR